MPVFNDEMRILEAARKLVSGLEPARGSTSFLLSTLGPLALDSGDIAWAASDKLSGYWLFSEVAEHEVASYTVLRTGECIRTIS